MKKLLWAAAWLLLLLRPAHCGTEGRSLTEPRLRLSHSGRRPTVQVVALFVFKVNSMKDENPS